MITKLEIAGQRMTVSPDLQKYVHKKIGRLDRYVARHARESLHVEVKFKETKAKDKQQFTCAVVMHLPRETVEASETTVNAFAAVDIAEERLKSQLRKYKEMHADAKMHRKLFGRLRGRNFEA